MLLRMTGRDETELRIHAITPSEAQEGSSR